jgi:tRNA pseudouridine38-40 synthase
VTDAANTGETSVNRYFIYLSYKGKHYCGWQIQPNGRSVQQTLEEALAICCRQAIPLTGAGRTDSGVHASLMVAHFDSPQALPELPALVEKLNRLLPPDIAVDKIVPVSATAHARFDALSRTYYYYVGVKKDPFRGDYVCPFRKLPDFAAMNAACRILYEYTDFTSFSKLHTDTKTNNCRITEAVWTCEGDVWKFTITADRFLRNMVRAIVGTLLDVGRGKLSTEGFRRVIEAKDRGQAGTSAPAKALFLAQIRYADELFTPAKDEICG